MTAENAFKVTQLVDNGRIIQITLTENVSTEPITQKQMIMESVSKTLDDDAKEQVMPLLKAILHAQPTVKIKSYQQTQITIAMPVPRYESMGRPRVGDIVELDFRKV